MVKILSIFVAFLENMNFNNLIFKNIPYYTVQELGEYIARIWEDLQLAYFCCWSSKRFFTKIKKQAAKLQ